jgi:hypothetical protein
VNPTAASIARGAAMTIVLLLAAIVGLIAGNVINPDNGELALGTGPVYANVWGDHAVDAASAAGAPSYADPYRHRIEGGGAAPQAGDAIYENVWGNHADHDATDADSLTRPTAR